MSVLFHHIKSNISVFGPGTWQAKTFAVKFFILDHFWRCRSQNFSKNQGREIVDNFLEKTPRTSFARMAFINLSR